MVRIPWRKIRIPVTLVWVISFLSHAFSADALTRLNPQTLEKWRVDRMSLEKKRNPLPLPQPLRDVRANFHVHSLWSHDSRGTIEDIVAAAKRAGTEALFFTEHPSPKYDFFKDGHQGTREGVLLFPGAETAGFLAFPTQSIKGSEQVKPQDLSDLITRNGGLSFLSHPEERLNWSIRGMTGMEIYNTHAIFKDQKKLVSSLKNPLFLINLERSLKTHPQECFSALHEYPELYLKRWDELTLVSPLVGISANDSHQNVGVRIFAKASGKAQVTGALGDPLMEVDLALLKPFLKLPQEIKENTLLFHMQLDPYEFSLRHVATHLLTEEFTHTGLRKTVAEGRCYVSFDWIADAKGFQYYATLQDKRMEMGAQLSFKDGVELKGHAPVSGTWKLIRNGQVHSHQTGDRFHFRPTQPGTYRIEVWQNLGGEELVWILSNPIYLK